VVLPRVQVRPRRRREAATGIAKRSWRLQRRWSGHGAEYGADLVVIPAIYSLRKERALKRGAAVRATQPDQAAQASVSV
jgi:hypothetical protein